MVKDNSLDRRFYEMCVLSELKNALRSGDIWVKGSRQFKDFNDYLITEEKFVTLKNNNQIIIGSGTNLETYLEERISILESLLKEVNQQAKRDNLPDVSIANGELKITPLSNSVPKEASDLITKAYAILPRIKITELLMEVDSWIGFSNHFTHIKSGNVASDKMLLLTTILSNAINLGLSKMAESCPGTTYAKLSWLQAWHIRDHTYTAALAEMTNAQRKHPFARHWGDSSTSSSDGQGYKVGGHAGNKGKVVPKF